MNAHDINRMAREAGFPFNKYGLLQGDDDGEIDADEMLKRLAVLVAAAEREACAELLERQHTWVSNAAASAIIRARGAA